MVSDSMYEFQEDTNIHTIACVLAIIIIITNFLNLQPKMQRDFENTQ